MGPPPLPQYLPALPRYFLPAYRGVVLWPRFITQWSQFMNWDVWVCGYGLKRLIFFNSKPFYHKKYGSAPIMDGLPGRNCAASLQELFSMLGTLLQPILISNIGVLFKHILFHTKDMFFANLNLSKCPILGVDGRNIDVFILEMYFFAIILMEIRTHDTPFSSLTWYNARWFLQAKILRMWHYPTQVVLGAVFSLVPYIVTLGGALESYKSRTYKGSDQLLTLNVPKKHVVSLHKMNIFTE